MLIDTHSHLNFAAYKDDVDEVIKRSLEGGVWMINVGSQYSTSRRAVNIAQRYDRGVYAAVGLHPIHLADGIFKAKLDTEEASFNTHNESFDYQQYKELALSEKVVAIGEIGLDYYYKPKTKKRLEEFKNLQKEIFLEQLELAKELNLPIIFHCRTAHEDLIEILNTKYLPRRQADKIQNTKPRGVVHCFTGTWQQAQKYLEMGFYLGFNGIIFKLDLDEVIKNAPLDKILIETDCPYLLPPLPAEALAKAGFREGRNEPLYTKYIAEKVAKIKNLSYKDLSEITTQNAKKLFKIKASV
ncbi:MAG: TatD family hydrolase [bacterium]